MFYKLKFGQRAFVCIQNFVHYIDMRNSHAIHTRLPTDTHTPLSTPLISRVLVRCFLLATHSHVGALCALLTLMPARLRRRRCRRSRLSVRGLPRRAPCALHTQPPKHTHATWTKQAPWMPPSRNPCRLADDSPPSIVLGPKPTGLGSALDKLAQLLSTHMIQHIDKGHSTTHFMCANVCNNNK